MEKRPLSFAREIVIAADRAGYAGLRAYTLSHAPMRFLTVGDESLQAAITICGNGRSYFMWWLGDEDQNNIPLTRQYSFLDINQVPFEQFKGVYYFYLELKEESHYFVLIVNDEEIIYAGTYGGVCGLTLMSHRNKKEYIERFKSAMKGSLKDYKYVFSLENPEVSSVKFEKIYILKSPRYE